MKIRFCAALLLAALCIYALSGCAAPAQLSTVAQPQLTIAETPVPAAEVPIPAAQPPVVIAPPTESVTEPVPASASNRITRDEAIAIALQDAGFTADQVSHLHAEFDYDNGRPEYDVDFRQGGYEYDYEIHAESGKILTREKDRD